MTDIRQKLNILFNKKNVITESKNVDLNEKLWDDIKGAWSKGKEIGKSPVKNFGKSLINKIGNKVFNKKDPVVHRVAGTGEPNSTPTVKPAEITSNSIPTVKPITAAPSQHETKSTSNDSLLKKEIPTLVPNTSNQSLIPKTDKKNDTRSSAILNPIGIELQGVEDPNQKNRKILNPMKALFKKKNKEFAGEFDKIKIKNGVTSQNSLEEVSTKDPTDISRKTIIRNLFAAKFYEDAYLNLLKNLRNLNIISENKIDSGVFQQAILNSLETSKERHIRRYSLQLKKIESLSKNVKEVKSGLKKGEDVFKRDMNDLYKANKDRFTMLNMQEGFKINGFFSEKFFEADVSSTSNDSTKEDNTIRTNDYVWWLDANELGNILQDEKKRNKLTFEGYPIEFISTEDGTKPDTYVDGSSATIKFLKGPKVGESEKIDIRNIEVPQDLAKTLVKFGKVIGDKKEDTADIDTKIKNNMKIIQDIVSSTAEISKAENKNKKLQSEKDNKSKNVKSKIQLFISKDPNNLDKTIASGKTKITPDPSGKTVEMYTKELVKLNKEGKGKLIKVIGVTAIILHSIFTLISPNYIHGILTKFSDGLSNLASKFGDLSGSKTISNFGSNKNSD